VAVAQPLPTLLPSAQTFNNCQLSPHTSAAELHKTKQNRKREARLICLAKRAEIWEHEGEMALNSLTERGPDSRRCIIHQRQRGKPGAFHLFQSQSSVSQYSTEDSFREVVQ